MVVTAPPSRQELWDSFARTTAEMFSRAEFEQLLDSGRQLRIKYGVDVTAPYLHIGHAVNLWMMRRLQDMGHRVLFLIGDFTTRIGDPTGRNRARAIIPTAEIEANAEAFIAQARLVLRFDDPNLLEIRRNSEWYDSMAAADMLRLLSMVTHARLAARDMFQERMRQGLDIHMHEMIYPVLQGYNSFALNADLTIIGSDQLYNEMLGRFYQERLGQTPQVIITTRITPGLDGHAKQSKSLGNYVGLGHSPRDKFGRVMTLPDELTATYFEVYTDLPQEQITAVTVRVAREPMACKLMLAREIVMRYHGAVVADAEQQWFTETFSARRVPSDIPEVAVEDALVSAFALVRRCLGAHRSNSEIRRLFEQGGITLNGQTLARPEQIVHPADGSIVRVGKRTWFRLRPAAPGGIEVRGEG